MNWARTEGPLVYANGAPSAVRHACQAEPDADAGAEPEPSVRPRQIKRLRRLLGNFSLPWPSGIGGLIGGFAQRPPAPYAEEAAEAESASPPHTPQGPEATSVEPTKTEDQTMPMSSACARNSQPPICSDFTRKNHPDRFEPGCRANAARHMSIANMLIDEQMRQSRVPRSPSDGFPV